MKTRLNAARRNSVAPFGGNHDAPFLIAAALAVLPGCQSASAQDPCDQRERMLSVLAEKYQEAPVAIGVTTEGSLIEVLINEAGPSWTIVITSPQHVTCVLLTGQGWKKLHRFAQEPETYTKLH